MTQKMEYLGNRSRVKNANNTNRIQEIEERISAIEDTTEDNDKQSKKLQKNKNFLTKSIQKLKDTMKRQNKRIIGIEDSEFSQFKRPAKIFSRIIEENYLT
jgi:CHASE3 domain sensor protein